jgi:hypothetical protein
MTQGLLQVQVSPQDNDVAIAAPGRTIRTVLFCLSGTLANLGFCPIGTKDHAVRPLYRG